MEEKLIVKGVVKFMGIELPEILGGFAEGKKVWPPSTPFKKININPKKEANNELLYL